MYKWHNGTRRSDDGSEFIPGWTFDPIEESLQRYAVLAEPSDDADLSADIWNANWFPFLSSSDISSYGIVCNDHSTDDGEIVCYEYTLDSEVDFVSLQAMLQTILACYETGVYHLDAKGQLEVGTVHLDRKGRLINVDISKFNEVARRFNPGLKQYD